ncbi:MAG: sensor histidine kinase [Proteobacteria bacterium]|nr:sensor histidine kinase [Pseudomonadota bacterium]
MANAEPLTLEEHRTYPLAGHLDVFKDPTAQLDFGHILSYPISHDFKAIPGYFNEGFGSQVIWLRFQVRQTVPFSGGAYLALGSPVLDYVTVYVQIGGNSNDPDAYRESRLGDHIPVSESQRYQPDFVVPLNLTDGVISWVYIRLQTSSNLALLGSIKPGDILAQSNNIILILQVAMLSVYLFTALISLLLYIRLRQSLFGFYGMFLLFLFNNRISATGILPLVFPSFAHHINDIMVYQNACGACIFLVLFGSTLFEPVLSLRQRQFFRLLLMIASLTFISTPFLPIAIIFCTIFVIGICLFSLMIWLSFKSLKKNIYGSFYYCVAFSLILVGPALELLRLTGKLPTTMVMGNLVQFVTFGNIMLLTLGLADKLRIDHKNALLAERNAKQNAQEMATEMTVELRQKQQMLEDTLERQVRFVSMVTHEYRTPLAVIRINLDLLSKKKHEPRILNFAVNKMQRATARLMELLEVNLDKAKFAKDDFQLRVGNLGVLNLVEEVIGQAGEFWPWSQLDLSTRLDADMIVSGDRRLLKTALLNLLDNAIKYSPEGSAVEVNVCRQGTEAVIDVIDQGVGIPPEERERVFEKYYRIPGNESVLGSGMGLYLVKIIVGEHHGTVAIQNNGSGTTVTVRLPVITAS